MRSKLYVLVWAAVLCSWPIVSSRAQSEAAGEPKPTPEASARDGQTASSKATSHDRHMRRHRSGSRRHRHRTTAKANPQ